MTHVCCLYLYDGVRQAFFVHRKRNLREKYHTKLHVYVQLARTLIECISVAASGVFICCFVSSAARACRHFDRM